MFGTWIANWNLCSRTFASIRFRTYVYINYEGRLFWQALAINYFYNVKSDPTREINEGNLESLEPQVSCSTNVQTCLVCLNKQDTFESIDIRLTSCR